jgi:hypothetical protein
MAPLEKSMGPIALFSARAHFVNESDYLFTNLALPVRCYIAKNLSMRAAKSVK